MFLFTREKPVCAMLTFGKKLLAEATIHCKVHTHLLILCKDTIHSCCEDEADSLNFHYVSGKRNLNK